MIKIMLITVIKIITIIIRIIVITMLLSKSKFFTLVLLSLFV